MKTWRIGLFPALVAGAIVLGTSPLGHAGLLSLHLATADHDVPQATVDQRLNPVPLRPHAPENDDAVDVDQEDHHRADHSDSRKHHDHGSAEGQHQHADDGHATDEAHQDAPEAEQRIAGAPHAHGGLIHTHVPRSGDELVLPSAPFSKFYLVASAAPLPRITRDRSRTPWTVPSPEQAVASIESPPPQPPG
jgi:hypothetical protein